MGTDIHGVWQKKTEGGEWMDIPSEYKQERHYLLFAWLGNVRNGFGFAGVATHTPIKPLTSQRGLPEDFINFNREDCCHSIADPNVKDVRRQKYWEEGEDGYLEIFMGDHSHSWITVDEVLSAKPPSITRFGVIDIGLYRRWDGKSAPSEYCGDISGRGITINMPENITDKTTHVRVEWEEDCSKTLKYFIDECRRLKELHGEVRFVFGFDS